MNIQETYTKETGLSPFDAKKKGFFTEHYVTWLKNYVEKSSDLAPKLFREYVKKDNDNLSD